MRGPIVFAFRFVSCCCESGECSVCVFGYYPSRHEIALLVSPRVRARTVLSISPPNSRTQGDQGDRISRGVERGAAAHGIRAGGRREEIDAVRAKQLLKLATAICGGEVAGGGHAQVSFAIHASMIWRSA